MAQVSDNVNDGYWSNVSQHTVHNSLAMGLACCHRRMQASDLDLKAMEESCLVR